MVNKRGKEKSFHAPLNISLLLIDQWKETLIEPFVTTLVSLASAEEFRGQSKTMRTLSSQLRDFASHTDELECKKITNSIFQAIFSVMENDSQQEKPTHLPAEFYSILRNLFHSVPTNIAQYSLCNFLDSTIHRIEENGHCYTTLQLLDVLLLHRLWEIPETRSIESYYEILIDGCAEVLLRLADQINTARHHTDQSVVVQNSLKIESTLQILLRLSTTYRSELKGELIRSVQSFKEKKEAPCQQINRIFSSLTLVLEIDSLQQESTTQAGLLLCQLLSFLEEESADLLLDQILLFFFPDDKDTSNSNYIQWIAAGHPCGSWLLFPVQSKLAVYRGLCIAMSGSILTRKYDNNGTEQTLLFDAIFPAILDISLNLTVPLRKLVAFQSIKNACLKIGSMVNVTQESWPSQLSTSVTEAFLGIRASFFFGQFYTKLVDVFWRTWEYHYEPVLYQLRDSFDSLIDTQQHIIRISKNEEELAAAHSFMEKLIKDMLQTEWNKRGKFAIFSGIFRAVGSQKVLSISPAFLDELFGVFSEPKFSGRGSTLLTNLLNNWHGLEAQSESTKLIKQKNTKIKCSGKAPFEQVLPTFIRYLCSENTLLQYGMVTYTIPIVLQTYPDQLRTVLHAIAESSEQDISKSKKVMKTAHMVALLSVVKHCRKQGSLSSRGLEELINECPEIPFNEIIHRGLTSGDQLLRHTTLESICETRSLSEPLTAIETKVLETFLRYCLRDSLGNQGRHETGFLLQKLLVRYKANLRQQLSALRFHDVEQLPLEHERFLQFFNSISNQILVCLYPRAPFLKMSLAVYLYNQLLLDVWGYVPGGKHAGTQRNSNKPTKTGVVPTEFLPEDVLARMNMYSSEYVQTLLGGLWDSFEKTRELLFDTLRKFPVPIPSLSFHNFTYYLASARALICSSRARNGEIGAMLIRICYFQYLKDLPVPCDPSLSILVPTASNTLQNQLQFSFSIEEGGAEIRLFAELLSLLEEKLSEAIEPENIQGNHSRRAMHGILITFQFLTKDLRFHTLVSRKNVLMWREVFTRLLEDLFSILRVAMSVIADVTTEGWTPSFAAPVNPMNPPATYPDEYEEDEDCEDADTANQGRQVIVGSWLMIKSVSLLLGTLLEEIPLQSNENEEKYILTNQQVQGSAERLLHVLLSTRHKGVLEKTYVGFEAICQRLFESQISELLQLPPIWLSILMDKVTNASSIITRRSAGIPLAICAILRAEARQSLNIHPYLSSVMKQLLLIIQNPFQDENHEMSIVHGFNVLRAILKDKILASRVDSWIAEYFESTIDALSHPSWAIRNAASLSFSVLISRTLGVSKRNIEERSRSTTTTFSILFSRLAPMYPYLLRKFQELLDAWKQSAHSQEKEVFITQTSLYSLLVLLSRLSPSERVLRTNCMFDSRPFIPMVMACSSHSDFRVREMAARSLVPLIACNDVLPFIHTALSKLPASHEAFSRTAQSQSIHSNTTHGILLQIYYLYKENLSYLCSEGNTASQREHVIHLLTILPNLFWMIFSDCFVISNSFLDVLYLIESSLDSFAINNEERRELERMALLFSVERVQEAFSTIPSNWQPMRITWRRNVASFCCKFALRFCVMFQDVCSVSSTSFLCSLVNDEDYEIRSEVLQHLLRSVNDSAVNWREIQQIVLQRIPIETNEEVSSLLLHLLREVSLSLPEEALQETSDHWKCLQIFMDSSSSLVQQQVLEYFGFYVFQQTKSSHGFTGCYTFWVSKLERCIQSSEPMEFRYAAMRSVLASRLLEGVERDREMNDILVRCWLLVAVLLEDDDDDIRNDVLEYLSFRSPLPSYSPVCWEKESHAVSEFHIETSLSPSLAKESIFALLRSQYFDNMALQYYLYRQVCEEIMQQEMPPWEATNQKLFTKELDNMWEEPLFHTQLCGYTMARLIEDGQWKVKVENAVLLKSTQRLYDMAKSFYLASEKNNVMTIVPFADQTSFLYLNQLFVSVYCIACMPFEYSPVVVQLLADCVELFQSSLLPSIARHSLSFIIEKYNRAAGAIIPDPFKSDRLSAVSLFFTTPY